MFLWFNVIISNPVIFLSNVKLNTLITRHNIMAGDLESHAITIKRFACGNYTRNVFFNDWPD